MITTQELIYDLERCKTREEELKIIEDMITTLPQNTELAGWPMHRPYTKEILNIIGLIEEWYELNTKIVRT